MKEYELFAKAWLFLYAAAGQNIGFEVRPASKTENSMDAKKERYIREGSA